MIPDKRVPLKLDRNSGGKNNALWVYAAILGAIALAGLLL